MNVPIGDLNFLHSSQYGPLFQYYHKLKYYCFHKIPTPNQTYIILKKFSYCYYNLSLPYFCFLIALKHYILLQ